MENKKVYSSPSSCFYDFKITFNDGPEKVQQSFKVVSCHMEHILPHLLLSTAGQLGGKFLQMSKFLVEGNTQTVVM